MIRNIILDVGNVLVAWEPQKALHELGIGGDDIEAILDATVRSEIWNETDRNARDEEEVLSMMAKQAPEYEKEIRLFWDQIHLAIWQFDYTRSWVRDLRKNGYRVYILSNYSRSAYEKTRNALSFLEDVDGALFSYEVQCIKPEPDIYRILLERFELKAEECIFLDDRAENVAGALAQGIHGIPFRSYEEALQALRSCGVKI